MGRAGAGAAGAPDPPPRRRLSKAQRRLATILQSIPAAREQLLVAMEEFGADFDLQALTDALTSADPRERNKVAVVERELEVLVNHLDELAARGLAEGQRVGVVKQAAGHPWERLAALKVISKRSATRLQQVKELRDDLQHAYPLDRPPMLHAAVTTLLDDLDRYVDRFERWASGAGILP